MNFWLILQLLVSFCQAGDKPCTFDKEDNTVALSEDLTTALPPRNLTPESEIKDLLGVGKKLDPGYFTSRAALAKEMGPLRIGPLGGKGDRYIDEVVGYFHTLMMDAYAHPEIQEPVLEAMTQFASANERAFDELKGTFLIHVTEDLEPEGAWKQSTSDFAELVFARGKTDESFVNVMLQGKQTPDKIMSLAIQEAAKFVTQDQNIAKSLKFLADTRKGHLAQEARAALPTGFYEQLEQKAAKLKPVVVESEGRGRIMLLTPTQLMQLPKGMTIYSSTGNAAVTGVSKNIDLETRGGYTAWGIKTEEPLSK